LAGLTDVDVSARTDGSLIQYDAAAGKFKVKPIIEDTNSLLKINGGSF
jgi:phage baseplate assembly protein gpV